MFHIVMTLLLFFSFMIGTLNAQDVDATTPEESSTVTKQLEQLSAFVKEPVEEDQRLVKMTLVSTLLTKIAAAQNRAQAKS